MAVPTRLALSKNPLPQEDLLEVKLKHYLARGVQGPDSTSALELHNQIFHPRMVLNSSLLPEDHPLKKEAWVVSDAFEAVTNGMENPGALTQLSFIGDHSPFYFWKLWIQALGKFYEDQPATSLGLLKAIPKDSPLNPAVKVLTLLCGGSLKSDEPHLKRFCSEVMVRDERVFEFFEEILDGIDTGMEDLFQSGARSLLEFLVETQDPRSPDAALWLISQLDHQEFSPEPLIYTLKNLLGTKESCRLLALGLLSTDPEGALLFWLQYLIAGWEDPQDDPAWESTAVGIFIDFIAGVLVFQKDRGEDEEFVQSFSSLISRIPEKLRVVHFPWKSWEQCKLSQTNISAKPSVGPAKNSTSPLQLDLFAC